MMGEAVVYASAMGTVIRCPGCGAAMIRVVEAPNRLWLDLSGARLLEIRTAG
jgi:hypothetical protein